jgi:hypothetical protein
MILLYLLFALTLSTILTMLFGPKIPEQKRGEAFIVVFTVLMLAAWAIDEWLLPIVGIEGVGTWVPDAAVLIFVAMLIASAAFSTRSRGLMIEARVHHGMRQDSEAIGFDIVLLILLMAFGITVLTSILMK